MRFCIVGTGRCGSTVLSRMLNCHPDVHVFNETHWIPKMHEFFGMGRGLPGEFMRIVRHTYHITNKLVTEIDEQRVLDLFQPFEEVTLREFCDCLGMLVAGDNGKKYWADKTPDYGPWLGVIKKHWPECKIIHLVRHGANVADSMSKHPGYQWMASAGEDSWVPASFNQYYKAVRIEEKPIQAYSALWYRRFMRIRDEVASFDADSYREFRFESFATEAESALREIAAFVGLDANEEWLTRSQKELNLGRIQTRLKNRKLDFLSERELCLLRELGYE